MNVMYNQDEWRVNHSSFPKNMAPVADVTSSRAFFPVIVKDLRPRGAVGGGDGGCGDGSAEGGLYSYRRRLPVL